MNEVFREIEAHFRVTSEPDFRRGLGDLLRAVEAWLDNPNVDNTRALRGVAEWVRKDIGNAL